MLALRRAPPASEVVARFEDKTWVEPVWVGERLVQLGPLPAMGQMPRRYEPGYWKYVSRIGVVAVLASGDRVRPKSSLDGWSDGAMVCISCRDANAERLASQRVQRARELQRREARQRDRDRRLQEALAAVPAIRAPVRPTPPGILFFGLVAWLALIPCYFVAAFTADDLNESGWVKLWVLASLGVSLTTGLFAWARYGLVTLPRYRAAVGRAKAREAERDHIRQTFAKEGQRDG